jgi:hydrogenase expression/formation protein HypE
MTTGGPTVDPTLASCPTPRIETEKVTLGHGSGGQLSAELLRDVLLPALGRGAGVAATTGPAGAAVLEDAAVLEVAGISLVTSTDGFVVSPLFFPGGDIGALAVHGTINDLAMMGATPLALTVAYIIEEGFPLDDLRRIVASVGAAAAAAGVPVVTGDTKVVSRGAADGIFVTTTGIGRRLPAAHVSAAFARPGDAVLISGPIGAHGTTVLSTREGLGFETEITSDTRPLHGLVHAMVGKAGGGIHVMRDPTRGGVASALGEIAAASGAGIEVDEAAVPVPPQVAAACDLLGLDPLHVANEGCLVAVTAPDVADEVLAVMRSRPEGRHATRLGDVVTDHPGRVVMRTLLGSTRVVDMLVGEQLPRIC